MFVIKQQHNFFSIYKTNKHFFLNAEKQLEAQARGVHADHPARQERAEPHSERGKPQWPDPAASLHQPGLRAVQVLQAQVRPQRRRTAHPQVQGHPQPAQTAARQKAAPPSQEEVIS